MQKPSLPCKWKAIFCFLYNLSSMICSSPNNVISTPGSKIGGNECVCSLTSEVDLIEEVFVVGDQVLELMPL